MTDERLQEMEVYATGTSSHEWHIRLLVAEVRRLDKEAGMWQGATKLALERAEIAQKQRDEARTRARNYRRVMLANYGDAAVQALFAEDDCYYEWLRDDERTNINDL